MTTVFMAIDENDQALRACATRAIAEEWLISRAQQTFPEFEGSDASWLEHLKNSTQLATVNSNVVWPYRIIEQDVLNAEEPYKCNIDCDHTDGVHPKPPRS